MAGAGSGVGVLGAGHCVPTRGLLPAGLCPCLSRARGWQLGLAQTWAQPGPCGQAGTLGRRAGGWAAGPAASGGRMSAWSVACGEGGGEQAATRAGSQGG